MIIKRKKIRKLLIVLPWVLTFGIYYLYNHLLIIKDKNANVIYGLRYNKTMLEHDEMYLFRNNDSSYRKIYVDNNKKIMNNEIFDSIINVSSTNSNKNFDIIINDYPIEDNYKFKTSGKIIALSDIEGNFDVFSEFLINNKVIDKNYNWIFGNGHLVLNGDFFDRGNDVTATLWLIYKIEREAINQNGKVHFIIGNHEEMNLRGYVKYVNRKYLTLANQLKIPYTELYGEDTVLGKWIRKKNAIIIVNDNLFCHGGISEKFIKSKISISEANNIIRKYLGSDKDYICFKDKKACFLFGREGVMWYRGYFGDYKDYYKGLSSEELKNIIKNLKVNHIIVGHTTVEKITPMFENKVIAIDVLSENDPRRFDDDALATEIEGLLIENNNYYTVTHNGKKELLFTD